MQEPPQQPSHAGIVVEQHSCSRRSRGERTLLRIVVAQYSEYSHHVHTHTVFSCITRVLLVEQGRTECVAFLLKMHARSELRTKDGYTALMVAGANGHPACMHLLLAAGADMRVQVHPRCFSLDGPQMILPIRT